MTLVPGGGAPPWCEAGPAASALWPLEGAAFQLKPGRGRGCGLPAENLNCQRRCRGLHDRVWWALGTQPVRGPHLALRSGKRWWRGNAGSSWVHRKLEEGILFIKRGEPRSRQGGGWVQIRMASAPVSLPRAPRTMLAAQDLWVLRMRLRR